MEYGVKVKGFKKTVINEREARAAAGILFLIGMLSLTNAAMLGNIIVTKYFVSFFTFDFFVRVINPSYSPSMLLGRFFVKNQIPEYVGAAQKRFAWLLGLILAIPMFYVLVIDFVATPIKLLICIVCLSLLFLESAFSICIGCKIYNLVNKEKSTNCPGGVCEVKKRDEITLFSLPQKIISLLTVFLLSFASYAYFTEIESKTHFGKMMKMKLMSDIDKKNLNDLKFKKELDLFESEEF